MLLEDTLIVVSDSQFGEAVHLEDVSPPCMGYVMTQARKDERHSLKVTKEVLVPRLIELKNDGICALHHRDSMIVVMKRVLTFIVFVL